MFAKLFASFSNLRIAVVGDIMLDTYWWGSADRISPEAPVPVVALKNREYRLGGASNVALNLISMGANVTMHAITGKDEDGELLTQLMQEKNISTAGVLKNENRITSNKIRVISRNQHLLRIDHEVSKDIDGHLEETFINHTLQLFENEKPDVVIFEDYNKGLLTENVITTLIAYCREKNIITTVDPKRKNFFAYKNVDIFKPNLKEVWEGLNKIEHAIDLDAMRQIHAALKEKLSHKMSLITLSEKGVFMQMDNTAEIIPAHIRSIADVSGAGDTVIAVASLVYGSTKNIKLTAEISNLAGGLVCEEVGTVAINKEQLLNECNELLKTYNSVHTANWQQ